MKKKFLAMLFSVAICLSTAACGGDSSDDASVSVASDDTTESEAQNETDEYTPPDDFLYGYIKADYETFNSPASENGLEDTRIYVVGTIGEIWSIDTEDAGKQYICSITTEEGEEWVCILNSESFVDENYYDTAKGHKSFFTGIYQGYSDTEEKPAFVLVSLFDTVTGDTKNGLGSLLSNPDDANATDEPAEPSVATDDGMYLPDIPDTEENIINNLEISTKETQDGDIVVFLTNRNAYVIPDLELQVLFYKDGNIIDTDEDGHDVLVPENTVVSKMDAPSSYDDYEVKISVERHGDTYRNWIYDLEVESNIGEDNIIIQFANEGEVDIEELEYIVVFYSGDEITGTSYANDIYDISAGDTAIENVSTHQYDFDGYEIYINQAHTFDEEYINKKTIKDTLPENIGCRISLDTQSQPKDSSSKADAPQESDTQTNAPSGQSADTQANAPSGQSAATQANASSGQSAATQANAPSGQSAAIQANATDPSSANMSGTGSENTAVPPQTTSTSGGGEGNGENFNTYDNPGQQNTAATYVLNTHTMKIHYPSCSSVKKIAPQNYAESNSSVDALKGQGYSTCGQCFK